MSAEYQLQFTEAEKYPTSFCKHLAEVAERMGGRMFMATTCDEITVELPEHLVVQQFLERVSFPAGVKARVTWRRTR